MKLYTKWLLAFVGVMAFALLTESVLIGRSAELEVRRYAVRTVGEQVATALGTYYLTYGSWEGLEDVLPALLVWRPRANPQGNVPPGMAGTWGAVRPVALRVTDTSGRVVAETRLVTYTQPAVAAEFPIQANGVVVGYVTLWTPQIRQVVLEQSALLFLRGVRRAIIIAGLVAFVAALIIGGLWVRSVVAPLQALKSAAQAITTGNLRVRAPVQGEDEVAELARTFNLMAESLERAQRARQMQTADIAHELRNPLSVLQGTLEALADGVYAPTPENIEPALDQVRTLNRLIEDLRLLAQVDAGELRLNLGPVDIAPLLQRLVDLYRPGFQERNLALTLELAPDLPPVQGDMDRLTQVLHNILNNALRYVPAGKAVRLLAQREGAGLTIRIADTGAGLPPEQRERIFERFWRAEASRSRETGGSGLGLTIARQIVLAHGGRIWAEETPGGGLTIAFWLPAALDKS